MLINSKKKRKKNIDSQFAEMTSVARGLAIVFIVFNMCTIGYTKIATKYTSDPIIEAKMINQMVSYHFISCVVIAGGLFFSSLVSDSKND